MLVLLIIILYSITNVVHCNVFYVTADDDIDDGCCYNNSLCGQCYNLQYYVLNISGYLTSDTQLHFLPGLHHLSTIFMIQNLRNFSLIGSRYTTINCTGEYQIILEDCSNVTMKDLIITKCGFNISSPVISLLPSGFSMPFLYTVALFSCSSVTMMNIEIISRNYYDAIMNVNVMGNSSFHNIMSAGMIFYYHDNIKIENFTTAHILVDNYQCNLNVDQRVFVVNFGQMLFNIYLKIVKISSCSMFDVYVNAQSCNHHVIFIEINDCVCFGEIAHKKSALFEIAEHDCTHKGFTIQFRNCHFISVKQHSLLTLINVSSYSGVVNIIDCTFVNTKNIIPITIASHLSRDIDIYQKIQNITTLIKNTSFISNISPHSLITISGGVLSFEGPVLFQGVHVTTYNHLIESSNIIIHFHNYIEISNCTIFYVFHDVSFFILKQPATLNISHNSIVGFFTVIDHYIYNDIQPICTFQYFNDENLDVLFAKKVKLNYSIMFAFNKYESEYTVSSINLRTTHCSWLMGSAFNATIPFDVNQQFINETMAPKKENLCYCASNGSIDCYKDQLRPSYPGETLNILLAYMHSRIIELIIDVHDNKLPPTACKISSLQEAKQIVKQTCTPIKLTILQANSHYKWCELIFKTYNSRLLNANDAFYVRFHPCPAGFKRMDGRCQCDPILQLSLLSIDNCDINDQTISRPSNSWISATTNNRTFTYLVSDNCPFDYCLPYSSHLKLSLTADLQCQFRRHNLLCGQCSDGLSTIFGSSHCQQCSNASMFIIIPIAILGLLLVVLLFFLNLTVADGTINAFILYVSILSINSTVFFPLHYTASVASYIFISISNLDMGIQMCFYDGMDDYAKMWLQLLFPLYLIVIAAMLIITSRYSSKVQRLTARRALPVLATLFLLSYTKILRTVSSVLFSYSTIIHLPSNHSKLVWSVDANVDTFEIKFIILFIVCLVIFILLIPFNITLLFTRTLSRFRIVNYFKPLLDVYQGPFKIKFYNWIGLHLVIRALFFGLSALDKKLNLLIGSVILIAVESVVGYACPYKNSLKNLHEMILLFNLNVQYVLMLSGDSFTAVNVMIALAAIQFIFIVIYHIFNYTLSVGLKSKMQQCISTLGNRSIKKFSNNLFQLHDFSYRDRIPEITYNYSEYQEPLVGED